MLPRKNSLWINVIALNLVEGGLEQSLEAQDLGKMAEQVSSDLRPPQRKTSHRQNDAPMIWG